MEKRREGRQKIREREKKVLKILTKDQLKQDMNYTNRVLTSVSGGHQRGNRDKNDLEDKQGCTPKPLLGRKKYRKVEEEYKQKFEKEYGGGPQKKQKCKEEGNTRKISQAGEEERSKTETETIGQLKKIREKTQAGLAETERRDRGRRPRPRGKRTNKIRGVRRHDRM